MNRVEEKNAIMAKEKEDISISRRNLLVGSVGATVGGLLAADAAMAQSHGAHGAVDHIATGSHAHHSGSLSNRIYSINPMHPDTVDIAENPINIPPPIT